MKTQLASIIRHALSGLGALGGLLANRAWIDPADAASLDAAGVQVSDGVAIICAAILSRMILTLLGKMGAKPGGKPTDKASLIIGVLALSAMLPGLVSCAALGSAFTGQPIHATPVQRVDGIPFQVATTDIVKAEISPPETIWGLYDAGKTAAMTSEVISYSGK